MFFSEHRKRTGKYFSRFLSRFLAVQSFYQFLMLMNQDKISETATHYPVIELDRFNQLSPKALLKVKSDLSSLASNYMEERYFALMDAAFYDRLLESILHRYFDIKTIIHNTQSIHLTQTNYVIQSLLWSFVYELYFESQDKQALIKEYVVLAEVFLNEKDKAFVHALMDKIPLPF